MALTAEHANQSRGIGTGHADVPQTAKVMRCSPATVQGDVAVPAIPSPDLVLIQSQLSLGLFYGPTSRRLLHLLGLHVDNRAGLPALRSG